MSVTAQTDILIAGGGLTGLTAAIGFAHSGCAVTLLEKADLKTLTSQHFDGRVSAIALANKHLLERYGVWEHVAPHAEPILDIRISDSNSHHYLHYDHAAVGKEPMGYIVENRYLRKSLWNAAGAMPTITLKTETCCTQVQSDVHRITAECVGSEPIAAKLLIVAEGKHSNLRKAAGITTTQYDYKQTAIVTTIAHEKPHCGIAQERFLPAGPFAILPMNTSPEGVFRSSLVWTEKAHLAPVFLAMDDADFLSAISERFTDYLGNLTLAGPRFSYPVTLQFAESYSTPAAPRLVLVGDSAHAIHPIAGQGFNLGLADINALVTLVSEMRGLGLDYGSATMLEQFAQVRRPQNAAMIMATDSLNRLFSNRLPGVTLARRLGLSAVEHLPALKSRFMQHAMGV